MIRIDLLLGATRPLPPENPAEAAARRAAVLFSHRSRCRAMPAPESAQVADLWAQCVAETAEP